jgi:biotin carboxylase
MAHLLIIELPGGNDTDIVQAALDRGDEFTFLTGQIDHYRRQPAVFAWLERARERIEVQSFDAAEVERQVLIADRRKRIDAVLCLIDTRMPTAARIASRLGLRFLNPASATLMRDKFLVRQQLEECGIAQPPFALATTNADLKAAVEQLDLPVLIKPADGYGSQNIVVLRHPEDLDPLLSPLEDLLPCRADYGLGVRSNDRMLVERYMCGSFIGCDTFSADGRHTLLGVHEKLMFAPPSFAMRGGCFRPNRGNLGALEQYVFPVLDAVRFDWGAAHLELMMTADGPRLVEINPRLVGAKIPRLVGHALNRSIHAELIALHAGEAVLVAANSPAETVAVLRWIVADRPGLLEAIDLPPQSDPRIRCVELLKNPGDDVRPPIENADRLGYVMACGLVRSELERLAEDFVAGARIKLSDTRATRPRAPEAVC